MTVVEKVVQVYGDRVEVADTEKRGERKTSLLSIKVIKKSLKYL